MNGKVTFDDYVLIDVAFNTQNGSRARAIDYIDGTDRGTNDMSDGLREVIQHFDQFGTPYANSFLAAIPERG